mmetsp:Transcript_57694/g.151828  ORF Transcript_57694/g.151828 Transcript_57694/m.151828 type:complete len:186 (+) Transcript_57694:52-609(+)
MSAAAAKRKGKREDWEDLDVNADSRLPATHGFIFIVNSLLLAFAPVYLFSAIFDLSIEEYAVWYGVVSVVSAIILTLACQNRAKNLRNRLIAIRGIELESTIQLKNKDSMDEKAKLKLQEAESKRTAINQESLALALSYTNSMFLATSVIVEFLILRSQAPIINYAVSTVFCSALIFYLSTIKSK